MGSCLGKSNVKTNDDQTRSNTYHGRSDNRVRMEKMEGIHRPVARLNV